MKLEEIEIHNIRGVRDLELKPRGRNMVIWGSNGTGKSTIVDAIDFLFTGKISRLSGQGSRGISLRTHGNHIDSDPKSSFVRAKIFIPELGQVVEVRRNLSKPNVIDCDEAVRDHVERSFQLFERGHYILTRRDILRYITAEPNERAKEIQALLNMTDIEKIRQALVNVQTEFKKELQSAEKLFQRTVAELSATVEDKVSEVSERVILEMINSYRSILGGEPIWDLVDIKKGINPPTSVSYPTLTNVTRIKKSIDALGNFLSDDQMSQAILKDDEELRRTLSELRSDPIIIHYVKHAQLLDIGLQLIEDGACPLCDTKWPPGELVVYLESKRTKVNVGHNLSEKISLVAMRLNERFLQILTHINHLLNELDKNEFSFDTSLLRSWQRDIECFLESVNKAVDLYPVPQFSRERIGQALAPTNITEHLTSLMQTVSDVFPELTPEQRAWDTLTTLEAQIRLWKAAVIDLNKARRLSEYAELLSSSFLDSRDKVLNAVYERAKERFEEFYRALHYSDEGSLTAKLEPDGAGIIFEIDFYGRGSFPPRAYHSEGHQDSMGLALYLAIADAIHKDAVNLLVLDDVVMAIDSDHRREICKLLSTKFPTKQFIITTHDRTWMYQLKQEGVVNSKNIVELYNWSIEVGPHVNEESDMWHLLDIDLDKNDVPSAAARLRRGSEQYFATLCDALQARVRFRLDGRWELGDYMTAAIKSLKDYLKMAKKAANSWGNRNEVERITEFESMLNQILTRIDSERWAVNPNVHYNQWANFTKADFRPVVDAFRDFFQQLVCSVCASTLRLSVVNHEPYDLRCNCGSLRFNLVAR
ncbi:MAG: AAA family ATPase [Alicyclobacillus sp.]|nr:AAA family ATPase [Alicyclobacillus sp.]